MVVFGPGESEGLRFGDVNTIGNNGEGPYHFNTHFLPWSESSYVSGVNHRSISLPQEGYGLVGDGDFKVSDILFSIQPIFVM